MPRLAQYDPALAVQPVNDVFLCDFCRNIIHMAVTIPCPSQDEPHYTCYECSHNPSSAGLCPRCVLPLEGEVQAEEEVRAHVAGEHKVVEGKKRRVGGLVMRCKNEGRGCKETTHIVDAADHYRICKHRVPDRAFTDKYENRTNREAPARSKPATTSNEMHQLLATYDVQPATACTSANTDPPGAWVGDTLDLAARRTQHIMAEHAKIKAERDEAGAVEDVVQLMTEQVMDKLGPLRTNVERELAHAKQTGMVPKGVQVGSQATAAGTSAGAVLLAGPDAVGEGDAGTLGQTNSSSGHGATGLGCD